jgi:hypothetical protein
MYSGVESDSIVVILMVRQFADARLRMQQGASHVKRSGKGVLPMDLLARGLKIAWQIVYK